MDFIINLLADEKSRSSLSNYIPTLHFFVKDFTICCFGQQAVRIAEEFYGTRFGLKLELGIESIEIQKSFFRKICTVLLEKHVVYIKIWQRRGSNPGVTCSWELKAEGSPGNTAQLELVVGTIDRDITSSGYMAFMKLKDDGSKSIALVIASTVVNHFVTFHYDDIDDLSKTKALLVRFDISVCNIINDDASSTSSCINFAQEVPKCLERNGFKVAVLDLGSILELNRASTSCKLNLAESTVISIISTLKSLIVKETFDDTKFEELIKHLESNHDSMVTTLVALKVLKIWKDSSFYATFTIEKGTFEDSLEYDRNVSELLELFPIGYNKSFLNTNHHKTLLADQENDRKSTSKCLLDIFTKPSTFMGSRLLKSWLQHPLGRIADIQSRQMQIKSFLSSPQSLSQISNSSSCLKGFPDLQRIALKIANNIGIVGLKDILDVYRCIMRADGIISILSKLPTAEISKESHMHNHLKDTAQQLTGLTALVEELVDTEHMQALSKGSTAENPVKSSSSSIRLFKDRYYRVKPSLSSQLQHYYDQIKGVENLIIEDFQKLQKLLGLEPKELHLESSEVHGYHYRVTKRVWQRVCKVLGTSSVRYKVLSNQKSGTLFLTNTAETLLGKFEGYKKSYEAAQESIVQEAVQVVRTYLGPMLSLSKQIAHIDVLCVLADTALKNDWVMPQFSGAGSKAFQITDLRHPILEEELGSMSIVKNDVLISPEKFVQIITGPNMGGKSTYLKAVGLAVILAHVGSFIPATSAVIPLFDRIYYRSGSNDCAILGISSFMGEMLDMAEILKNASSRSLVLIDELGRGTSTSDGFGLAWALLESLAAKSETVVLCATHFHDLNNLTLLDMKDSSNPFQSVHVDAHLDSANKQITMLYKISPGASNRSYGVYCAQVAGFPQEILDRSKELENSIITISGDSSCGSKLKRTREVAELDT